MSGFDAASTASATAARAYASVACSNANAEVKRSSSFNRSSTRSAIAASLGAAWRCTRYKSIVVSNSAATLAQRTASVSSFAVHIDDAFGALTATPVVASTTDSTAKRAEGTSFTTATAPMATIAAASSPHESADTMLANASRRRASWRMCRMRSIVVSELSTCASCWPKAKNRPGARNRLSPPIAVPSRRSIVYLSVAPLKFRPVRTLSLAHSTPRLRLFANLPHFYTAEFSSRVTTRLLLEP